MHWYEILRFWHDNHWPHQVGQTTPDAECLETKVGVLASRMEQVELSPQTFKEPLYFPLQTDQTVEIGYPPETGAPTARTSFNDYTDYTQSSLPSLFQLIWVW